MIIMVIFVLSIVPMVIAEQGDGTGPKAPNGNLGIAKERIGVAKEKMSNARERFLQAQNKYKDAKNKYQEQKEMVLQVRERVKACQDEETEDCPQAKKNLKVGVKNHLAKTGEVALRSLEKLSAKVEDSTAMTDEEKEEALDKISELTTKLEELISELEEMKDDATAEELRAKIKELKELWNDSKKESKWIITQLINNKMGNVVEKHAEYYNAMEMRYTNLEEQGASEEDLAELKEIMDEFKSAVDQLNEDYLAADAAWKEVKSNPEKLEEAKGLQQKVREGMKETTILLREFTSEFREINKELKSGDLESDEDEVEEEEEVEMEDESEVEEEVEEEEESENEEE